MGTEGFQIRDHGCNPATCLPQFGALTYDPLVMGSSRGLKPRDCIHATPNAETGFGSYRGAKVGRIDILRAEILGALEIGTMAVVPLLVEVSMRAGTSYSKGRLHALHQSSMHAYLYPSRYAS